MNSTPLLIFDFDGVIVDGMCEYWWSARAACLKLCAKKNDSRSLPHSVPEQFRQLRPWVHKGWEMVLLAAELTRPTSSLLLHGARVFSTNYQLQCQQALEAWNWSPKELQKALDDVRNKAISNDLDNWLALHQPYPQVVKRLQRLKDEGLEFAVLTTKGKRFTSEILNFLHLNPNLVYGHESGNKPELLLQLSSDRYVRGFIEDRRLTLEKILQTKGISSIPCYLVNWGYLKPTDTEDLPAKINLIDPKTFAGPLAKWP